MDAGKAKINEIFAINRLLEVPFYQRSYVWKQDQWERFNDDMEYVTATKKPYFLGSVILKELPTPTASESGITDRRVIIDGQQRLTTIMLFFKAYFLLTDDNDKFVWNFCLENHESKLIHGKADTKAFSSVMAIETIEEAKQFEWTDGKSNIVEAFRYFLANISPDAISKQTILGCVWLNTIDIQYDEDEQQIFDTINSLGVTLTSAELLKNYLFNRDNLNAYEQYWESIFEPASDVDTREWWNREIVTGRIKRTVIDLFFDSLLQILIQDPVYGVTAEDKIAYSRVDQLFRSYQDFLSNYYSKVNDISVDNTAFLEEMSRYAKLFKETFDPDCTNKAVSAHDSLRRLNVVIFGLKNSTLIPYVLYLVEGVQDKEELSELFDILESFIMRRIVTRETSKNYNRMFNSFILNQIKTPELLIDAIRSGDDLNARFPSDAELMQAFGTESKLTNLQTKGILYLIESSIRPKNSSTDILPFDSYSLEHLMPKKWRNNWDHPETKELEWERDKRLLTLGNLAIITQSLNASIRDANWNKKRAGKGDKNPGLNACSSVLATFEGVLDKEVWNEEEIAKRGKRLAEEAIEVWSYPEGY